MGGHRRREKPAPDVEAAVFDILVAGIEAQIGGQPYEEPEVVVSDSLPHRVELQHGLAEKVEQGLVGLDLADQPVQHLGHEHRDRAFAHIERDRHQRAETAHFPDAVHLRVRLFDTLEFDEKHRLEKRRLVAPAPLAADALHHVAHSAQHVREQIGDRRTVAVFDRMEYDAARFVGAHQGRLLRKAASFATARPR